MFAITKKKTSKSLKFKLKKKIEKKEFGNALSESRKAVAENQYDDLTATEQAIAEGIDPEEVLPVNPQPMKNKHRKRRAQKAKHKAKARKQHQNGAFGSNDIVRTALLDMTISAFCSKTRVLVDEVTEEARRNHILHNARVLAKDLRKSLKRIPTEQRRKYTEMLNETLNASTYE